MTDTELWNQLDPAIQKRIERGEAAIGVLKRYESIERWHEIGIASTDLRDAAMRFAGTNQPVGRRYNEAWESLACDKPGLHNLAKRDRSHAMWLHDNWEAVNTWLETLGHTVRLTLNHPTSIFRRYEAAHRVAALSETATKPRQKVTDRLIELQEQNDVLLNDLTKLRLENDELREHGLPPKMSIERLAKLLAKKHSPQKLRELAKALEEIATKHDDDKTTPGAPAEKPKRASRAKKIEPTEPTEPTEGPQE